MFANRRNLEFKDWDDYFAAYPFRTEDFNTSDACCPPGGGGGPNYWTPYDGSLSDESYICECDTSKGWFYNTELDDGSCYRCDYIDDSCVSCHYSVSWKCDECMPDKMISVDGYSCVDKIEGCIIDI